MENASTRKERAARIIGMALLNGEKVPLSVSKIRFSDTPSPQAKAHTASLLEKAKALHEQ